MRHRRQPTRNRMGWTSNIPNEVSEMFIAECVRLQQPALDIGAAFGVAAIPGLAQGAVVLANDLDPGHLEVLWQNVPIEHRERLMLIPGRFPTELSFKPESLGAVHASNVLHFLTGSEIDLGIRSIATWLVKEGKLFIHAGTPYQQPFSRFIPEYEARVRKGEAWPGWVDDTCRISNHRKLGQIPPAIHLLDPEVLRRVIQDAGMIVEHAWLYRRKELPRSMHWDGREGVGVIAKKI